MAGLIFFELIFEIRNIVSGRLMTGPAFASNRGPLNGSYAVLVEPFDRQIRPLHFFCASQAAIEPKWPARSCVVWLGLWPKVRPICSRRAVITSLTASTAVFFVG
jgi:hypothetical protein